MKFDVIVIGGGSSGMMAAGTAAELGKTVCILEKNASLGEKLKITGGGRCNVANAEEDIRVLLKNYGPGEPFLYSAFSQFGMKDTFTFFESRGLPLVVQARKRAFPHTEKAYDVYEIMRRFVLPATVHLNTVVKRINHTDGKIISVVTNNGEFFANTFIISTGGMSHPETGSTGDGFLWLKDLGHTIKSPTPTIVPLAVKEEWVKALSGTSLSFMKITFFLEGKKQFSKIGKVLFTHFGLSGPLILNVAGKVGILLESGAITAHIDAYPDTDISDVEKNIVKIFDMNKNKMLKNILKEIVPDGMVPGMEILLSDIDLDTKVHSVTKDERKEIVSLLKTLPVTITNLMGYDRAVVADGGVSLEEIDMKTMRSNIIENLFVTGDLLHINRPSGGYSLQLCWTTGYVAGKNA